MSAAPKTPVVPVSWHSRVPEPAECAARVGRLSPRQRQVIESLAAGWVPKEIARQLGVATKTIYAHLDGAFEVLGARPLGPALAVYWRAVEAPPVVAELRRRSDFGSRRMTA